ncbi:quinone oxidoreductase family protein [Oceanobacillus senegalensis]|uniref:quinone oxidoreductase family protein n=1 Tax=Oceanobacillus senegalensis TaxID=1936063 RepID=UPI000A30FB19|nr:zinc-binding dehydrogenase [Oceanobacillus senegalensis]
MEKPNPSENQVLIKNCAIGVNFADTRRRLGKYLEPTPLPFIPGMEVSGVVVEVGRRVRSFKPGDRVVSLITNGGYAEYLAVDESIPVHIPDGISYEQAVAIPLQGITAYRILKEQAKIEKGNTVLVHAAAGGVGLIAIQLAKIFGADKVIATSSSTKKLEITKSLGANYLVNYKANGCWPELVKEITSGRGADVILDSIGEEIFYKSLECLAENGKIVVYGRASGKETLFDPRHLMIKNQQVNGFYFKGENSHEKNKSIMQILLDYLRQNQLKVTIGATYPLSQANSAHKLIESRSSHGKIILKP